MLFRPSPCESLWAQDPCYRVSSPLVCVCAQPLSCVHLFATSWTVARQAPLSTGFPRQEYCSGLPFPPPGDLPDPGIELAFPEAPALASRVPPGNTPSPLEPLRAAHTVERLRASVCICVGGLCKFCKGSALPNVSLLRVQQTADRSRI